MGWVIVLWENTSVGHSRKSSVLELLGLAVYRNILSDSINCCILFHSCILFVLPLLSLITGSRNVPWCKASKEGGGTFLLAMNHTLSRLCGAPTEQAGITNGWIEYFSRSRSEQTVSVTNCCSFLYVVTLTEERHLTSHFKCFAGLYH